MERFNIKCPDHFPMKCNLSSADKDYLLTKEDYKAFFIFQYEDQDGWLRPAVERYFTERTWRLFNAGKEHGTGTKFCNICRYALASDFGIVSLTPLNHNVFQEIGLMQGLQKPLVYLLNPSRKSELPFDIDDQIYVEHTDEKTLLEGIEKKISLVIKKVQLLTGYESGLREHVKEKLKQLPETARDILKVLLYQGSRRYVNEELDAFLRREKKAPESISMLIESGFIIQTLTSGGANLYELNPTYRKPLEELLWER